jgi:hypothetical protein
LRLALTSAVAAWVTIGLLVARAVETEARRRLEREQAQARAALLHVLEEIDDVGIDTGDLVDVLLSDHRTGPRRCSKTNPPPRPSWFARVSRSRGRGQREELGDGHGADAGRQGQFAIAVLGDCFFDVELACYGEPWAGGFELFGVLPEGLW